MASYTGWVDSDLRGPHGAPIAIAIGIAIAIDEHPVPTIDSLPDTDTDCDSDSDSDHAFENVHGHEKRSPSSKERGLLGFLH